MQRNILFVVHSICCENVNKYIIINWDQTSYDLFS